MDIETVGELIEFLKQYPEETRVVYDYGLGLTVEEFECINGSIMINFC